MILTILIIVLILALLGGYPIHNRYGSAASMGWIGTLFVVIIILYLFGFLH